MTGTDIDAKRALNNGFGNALSRAFEFAVTPVVCAFLGLQVDRLLGWPPIVAVFLGLSALVWGFAKLWMTYERDMQAEEANAPWARPRPTRQEVTE